MSALSTRRSSSDQFRRARARVSRSERGWFPIRKKRSKLRSHSSSSNSSSALPAAATWSVQRRSWRRSSSERTSGTKRRSVVPVLLRHRARIIARPGVDPLRLAGLIIGGCYLEELQPLEPAGRRGLARRPAPALEDRRLRHDRGPGRAGLPPPRPEVPGLRPVDRASSRGSARSGPPSSCPSSTSSRWARSASSCGSLGHDPLDRRLAPEPTFWRAHEPNPLGPERAARHQF